MLPPSPALPCPFPWDLVSLAGQTYTVLTASLTRAQTSLSGLGTRPIWLLSGWLPDRCFMLPGEGLAWALGRGP